MSDEIFYRLEWIIAEKDGNLEYAKVCKEKYRQCVLKKIIKPHHFFREELKAYPTMIIN